MARVTLSRVLEISRYLRTKSGQELQPALEYLSDLSEHVIRNLKNGLTFVDNIDADVRRVVVKNGVETIIQESSRRKPVKIWVDRVVDSTFFVVDKFGWKFTATGEVTIKLTVDGSPDADRNIPVDITIVYG